MKQNIYRGLSTLAVVGALTLTSAGLSGASTVTHTPSSAAVTDSAACAAEADAATTTLQQLDGEQEGALIDTATAALDRGTITTHAPRSALDVDGIKVYDVDSAEAQVSSVTIPVNGEHSAISNVTMLIDDAGQILRSSETLVGENAQGNFAITSYVDGELTSVKNTDLAFMSDAELARADAPVSTQGAGSTVACVASVLGVSGATAYLIVGACTGACTAPVVGTAICVACIGAYATVGGASITAVAKCF